MVDPLNDKLYNEALHISNNMNTTRLISSEQDVTLVDLVKCKKFLLSMGLFYLNSFIPLS